MDTVKPSESFEFIVDYVGDLLIPDEDRFRKALTERFGDRMTPGHKEASVKTLRTITGEYRSRHDRAREATAEIRNVFAAAGL